MHCGLRFPTKRQHLLGWKFFGIYTFLEGPWRLQVEWREPVLRNGAEKCKEEGMEVDRRKRCGKGGWITTARQEVHGQEPSKE